ncbi:unnamed protein product, partial [Amoebophrya sp. A120]
GQRLQKWTVSDAKFHKLVQGRVEELEERARRRKMRLVLLQNSRRATGNKLKSSKSSLATTKMQENKLHHDETLHQLQQSISSCKKLLNDTMHRWVGAQIDPWGEQVVAMHATANGNLIPFVWERKIVVKTSSSSGGPGGTQKVRKTKTSSVWTLKPDVVHAWAEMSEENRSKIILSARPTWDPLGCSCLLPYQEKRFAGGSLLGEREINANGE